MNAKSFLNRAYKMEQLIKSDKGELEELRSLSSSIPCVLGREKVQTSNTGDKMANIVSKIVDCENKIYEEMEELIDLKIEIRETINKVENNDERLYLRYRYINFYSWKQICSELNYSSTSVKRIKDKAIESVEKILKKGVEENE